MAWYNSHLKLPMVTGERLSVPRPRGLSGLGALLVGFLGATLLPSGAALAHPLLILASPAPGAVLQQAPRSVTLLFTEDLNAQVSRVVVTDDRHRIVSRSNGQIVAGHPREMKTAIGTPYPGFYLVQWTAVSADDGHVVRGSYTFGFRTLAGTRGSDVSSGAPEWPSVLALLAHWVMLLAALTWLGSAVFSAFIFRPLADGSVEEREVEVEDVRVQMLLRLAAVALLVTGGVTLTLQAHDVWGGWSPFRSATALAGLLSGQYGQLWLVRQGLAFLLLVTTVPLPTHRPVPQRLNLVLVQGHSWHVAIRVPIALGMLYLYALAASGHAASAAGDALLGTRLVSPIILMDWIHLLATALWFGGQIYIVVILLPAVLTTGAGAGNSLLFGALDRFSPLAYASVAVLAFTGMVNSTVHISSWSVLTGTVYGIALIAKSGFTMLMLLVSAFTVYWLRPRARRSGTADLHRLAAWLHVNPWLGVGVLLATSVLAAYPPPIVPAATVARAAPTPGPELYGQIVHVLALGHTHSNLMFAGTEQGLYRRQGTIWRRILQPAPVWSIALQPNDRELIAGTSSGDIYVSRDRGDHWVRRRVTSEGIYAVTAAPGNGLHLVAGGGGGLFLSLDGGMHWQRRLVLHRGAAAALVWLPHNAHVVFAGTVTGGPHGEHRVFISRDAGLTWKPFGRGLSDGGGVMSLLVVHGRVYAGTMGRGVWQAPVSSGIWHGTAGGTALAHDHGAALMRLPGRPDRLIVGTLGHGAYQTADGGQQWKPVSVRTFHSGGLAVILSLAYSFRDHVLYAGTADGIYSLRQP